MKQLNPLENSRNKPAGNNDSSQIDGTVSKKIIKFTNKPGLSRQVRVPFYVVYQISDDFFPIFNMLA